MGWWIGKLPIGTAQSRLESDIDACVLIHQPTNPPIHHPTNSDSNDAGDDSNEDVGDEWSEIDLAEWRDDAPERYHEPIRADV